MSGARAARDDLDTFLDDVLSAGATIVQLREKDADVRDLLRWGERFRDAAARHGALFIVNDRPDVALALGADGVHLGQDDLPVPVARDILGPDAIVGVSTHSLAQFAGVAPDTDYACVGPVYATPTKPGRPATGIGLVRNVAASVQERTDTRPWFAIGGIDEHTIGAVVSAGAERVVVVRAVDTEDPAGSARTLVRRLTGVPV